MRTMASRRQMARTIKVKRIRDFNSGMRKQLLKVLAMDLSIRLKAKCCPHPGPLPSDRRGRIVASLCVILRSCLFGRRLFGRRNRLVFRGIGLFLCRRNYKFARSAFGFDFGFGGSAESVGADGEFFD